MNPIRTFPPAFRNIHFNIILPFNPRFFELTSFLQVLVSKRTIMRLAVTVSACHGLHVLDHENIPSSFIKMLYLMTLTTQNKRGPLTASGGLGFHSSSRHASTVEITIAGDLTAGFSENFRTQSVKNLQTRKEDNFYILKSVKP
jgi:hypothetical protein